MCILLYFSSVNSLDDFDVSRGVSNLKEIAISEWADVTKETGGEETARGPGEVVERYPAEMAATLQHTTEI